MREGRRKAWDGPARQGCCRESCEGVIHIHTYAPNKLHSRRLSLPSTTHFTFFCLYNYRGGTKRRCPLTPRLLHCFFSSHFHALLFDLLFHVVIIICLSPPCLDIVNLRFESGSIRIPSSFSLSPPSSSVSYICTQLLSPSSSL